MGELPIAKVRSEARAKAVILLKRKDVVDKKDAEKPYDTPRSILETAHEILNPAQARYTGKDIKTRNAQLIEAISARFHEKDRKKSKSR